MGEIAGTGYYLVPSILLQIVFAVGLGIVGLWGFIWAIRSGEMDNLEEAKYEMLVEEEDGEEYVNV